MLSGCAGSQSQSLTPNAILQDSAAVTHAETSASRGASGPFLSRTAAVPSNKGLPYTDLYDFDGGNGAEPQSGVIRDKSGAIYGTTFRGGADDLGTVFKLTPSGSGYTESFVYSFKGGLLDGAYPSGGVIFDGDGALYGTTGRGGEHGSGIAFKLTASGSGYTESVLYNFCVNSNCTDGANPIGSLVFGKGGALYGATSTGGLLEGKTFCPWEDAIGCGTVFKLTPSVSGYTETVLYSFCATTCADGAYPNGNLVFGKDGALYGTTSKSCLAQNHDCGTVFKLKRSGSQYSETTLYDFARGGYGDGLSSGVIFDKEGALWGTAFFGGGEYTSGLGSVFKLTRSRSGTGYTQSFVYAFKGGSDGSNPDGGVIFGNGGVLYGTTQGGGHGNTSSGTFGTLFTLTPLGSSYRHRVIHRFTRREGANPQGNLISDEVGALYGTASSRGSGGWGTVFKLTP